MFLNAKYPSLVDMQEMRIGPINDAQLLWILAVRGLFLFALYFLWA